MLFCGCIYNGTSPVILLKEMLIDDKICIATELVDAFYAAAIAAGGVDNGPPGPRPEYGPGFYGAFVLDATGNNIEACHIE